MITRDAAEQVRRGALPPTPNDYKAELPSDFQVPAGIDFKFDAADPLLAQAREVMHAVDQGKLSGQEAFSKFLGIYAGAKVGEQAQVDAATAAEIGKMGASGPARVTALSTFFEAAGAPEMTQMLVTEGIVRAAERLVSKFVSQGGATFSQSGRVAPEANTIPNYEGMTFAQRRQAQDELARRKA